MIGKVAPKFLERRWWPGIIITSALFTGTWGYLVYTGEISTIWPLFGMSNQLLASSALIIGTTMIIRLGKAKYAWITAIPGIFMAFVTMYAGYLLTFKNYIPTGKYLLAALSIIIMVLMVIVFVTTMRRWYELLQIKERVQDIWGESVVAPIEGEACLIPVDPTKSMQAKTAEEKWMG